MATYSGNNQIYSYQGIQSGEKLVAAEVVDALNSRQALLPIGTILMHTGIGWSNNNTVPGWYICDGSNGTPNLTDKFVRGGAQSTLNGQAVNESARYAGNNKISDQNLPSHTHAIGSHTHSVTGSTTTSGGHGHSINLSERSDISSQDTTNRYALVHPDITSGGVSYPTHSVSTVSNSGTHSHAFSTATASASTSTGTAGNTGNNAASNTDFLPAYYAIIYIMRVA